MGIQHYFCEVKKQQKWSQQNNQCWGILFTCCITFPVLSCCIGFNILSRPWLTLVLRYRFLIFFTMCVLGWYFVIKVKQVKVFLWGKILLLRFLWHQTTNIRFTNSITLKPNLPKRSFMTNAFTTHVDVNDYVNVCCSCCYFCSVFFSIYFFFVSMYTRVLLVAFLASRYHQRNGCCCVLCFFGLRNTIEYGVVRL